MLGERSRAPCAALCLLLVIAVVTVANTSLRAREAQERLQRENSALRRSAAAARDTAQRGGGAAALVLDAASARAGAGGSVAQAAAAVAAAAEERAQATQSQYSAAHCIGGESGGRSDENGWKRATCRFRALCFDPSDGLDPVDRFVYHRAPGDDFDRTKHSVALGPLNAQWPPQDTLRVRWAPRVEQAALRPGKFRYADSGEVWILHMEHCAANVMHLVMDSFLPWFAASLLFGLEGLRLRPLRVPIRNPGLWGTCDYIQEQEKAGVGWAQGYHSRCTANTARWLPAMIPGRQQIQTVDDYLAEQKGRREPICFPNAVAGVGILSDHCLRSHGWSSWDRHDQTLHDCNQGKGPILWGFRSHMLRTAGLRWPPAPPPQQRVTLFSGGHRAAGQWHSIKHALKERLSELTAQRAFGDTPVVSLADFRFFTALEQMRVLTSTTVAVAAMGGNAITLLFLPRGGGAVLLHDGKDWLDWDLWAHCSWMRAQWMPIMSSPADVAAEVVRQVAKYGAFRETPAPAAATGAAARPPAAAAQPPTNASGAPPPRATAGGAAAAAPGGARFAGSERQLRLLDQLRSSGQVGSIRLGTQQSPPAIHPA
eukprot:TRINITY_DN7780_c0_g1_i1.p1 TRINITY_DN7780_c0_g1~~TRINITY_DN7780_c0_g1_i1.p1  ORF type:complete len:627 (+),score=171.12 TRINITY_DN7780_c0_g1_i1:90-1883(+)